MPEIQDCNLQVSTYFECIGSFQNISDNKCKSLIDEYYKCLDIKRYEKGISKKKARCKQSFIAEPTPTEVNQIDYELYKLND